MKSSGLAMTELVMLTLQAETGYSLEIRFDSQFAIEDHYEEGCAYDWVKVREFLQNFFIFFSAT